MDTLKFRLPKAGVTIHAAAVVALGISMAGCGTERRDDNSALAAALGARSQLIFVGSCNTASANSVCRNVYRSATTATVDCGVASSTTKCPEADHTGRCVLTGIVSGGTGQDEYVYYSTGGLPYSTGSAEANCTGDLKGTYAALYIP